MTSATTILGMMLENACKWDSDVKENTYLQLMKNFRDALADYLENYVEYVASFTGTVTSTTPPTPLTQIPLTMGKLDATIIRTSNPPTCTMYSQGMDGNIEWITWMTQIYTLIQTVQLKGSQNPATPTTPSGIFPAYTMINLSWNRDTLKDAFENNSSVFDALANSIISDLKSSIITPSYPSTGTIGMQPVVGVDSITNIIYP